MLHGSIPAERFFPYLRWPEIAALPDRDRVLIIQPIGAIEQHGPHLPLVVDTAIATAVTGEALRRLPAEIAAYALPTLCYGKSNEHCQFPGTISLRTETLLAVLIDSAHSLYAAGFRRLIWLNGHGGQPQVLQLAARDLREQFPGFEVLPLFVWNVPNQIGELLTPREQTLGLHAGDAETSLMLHLLPDQVRMDQAIAEYPPDLDAEGLLSWEGNLPIAWLTHDLSQSGVIGDPTPATAAKGAEIFEQLVQGWVQVLTVIAHWQRSSLLPPK
ncbi:creatininase family protein [Synechococcus elongatus]|uniref:Creatininase n=1 Tax=Synechococcus elongatus (strain ATCC 33912 / PCC 7942 / FACHB-805) TaxID=1140 RepID=O33699_SYNE7|nr:creatininase family protein [Synechococcus elongatus]AAB82046.1 hypothetical protein [Synechococcus elongatus PCC 7942 = FACHB-805]AAM82649.1 creatininase [Synechococcus elongatus PCC 7942 = FACHB-805]ABB57622.1 creatinine amidohydrolase [Synechococcus elongatus PCC 7942 = FACHB-805]MBD2588430.1 creatininase family protein [Synechococcus elongatus FACHB-242]MBD2689407.1 creatininase family protein [Synechococcus elongatus FACHB-1061]